MISDDETAHQKNCDSNEQETAHHIRDEIKSVDETGRRGGEIFSAIGQLKTRDESFERIHEIDKGIRDETEEQPKVNRAQHPARSEDSLLEQNGYCRFDQTRRNVFQLRCRSSLANRVDDGFESVNCESHRCKRQQNKYDFLNRC